MLFLPEKTRIKPEIVLIETVLNPCINFLLWTKQCKLYSSFFFVLCMKKKIASCEKNQYCRPSQNGSKTSPNLKLCFMKIAHRMTYIQWLWLQQQNTAVASKASCSLSFSGLYSRPVVCFSRALTEYENTGMRLPCLELLLGRQAPLLYHIGLKNEKKLQIKEFPTLQY